MMMQKKSTEAGLGDNGEPEEYFVVPYADDMSRGVAAASSPSGMKFRRAMQGNSFLARMHLRRRDSRQYNDKHIFGGL